MGFLDRFFGRKREEPVDLTSAGPLARSLRRCKKCEAACLLIDASEVIFSEKSSRRKHQHEWLLVSERSIIDAQYNGNELSYLQEIDKTLKGLSELLKENIEARTIRIDCLSRISELERNIPTNEIEAHYYRAIKIYAEAFAFDLAAKELEKVVILEPDSIRHKNQLAIQYFLADNWQKAEAIWIDILRLHPNDEDALTQYTNALVQMAKKDPVQKIAYYKKILSLHPKSQRFHLALGVFYQDAHDWKEAITHLKEAFTYATEPMGGSASLKDFKAELKDRIARCYAKLGKWEEATQYWQEALTEKEWPSSEKRVIISELQSAQKNAPITLEPLLPEDVSKLRSQDTWVVDMRSNQAYNGGHLPNASTIPLDSPQFKMLMRMMPEGKRIILVLDDETDRALVVRRVTEVGFYILAGYLKGGVDAWRASGLPVETEKEW